MSTIGIGAQRVFVAQTQRGCSGPKCGEAKKNGGAGRNSSTDAAVD
jgi:hypothetical protein